MAWVVLLRSGVLEAIWATALGRSEGPSRPGPAALFLIALALGMAGLGDGMRHILVGTAYAVWVGIGAALTAGYPMAFGGEAASAARILLLPGIVACVVGLKLVSH